VLAWTGYGILGLVKSTVQSMGASNAGETQRRQSGRGEKRWETCSAHGRVEMGSEGRGILHGGLFAREKVRKMLSGPAAGCTRRIWG